MCDHYKNNHILLKCNTCNEFFHCRFCHNIHIEKLLINDLKNNTNNVKEHIFDRFDVTIIKCLLCNTEQTININIDKCIKCNHKLADYICYKCGLFDNSNTPKYHCNKCNICRIGNKEDNFHCDKCNICFNKNLTEHKCIMVDETTLCVICNEPLLDNLSDSFKLSCGHIIHTICIKKYLAINLNDDIRNLKYKCPICQKSLSEFFKLDKLWEIFELFNINNYKEIFGNDKVEVYCRDCEKKTLNYRNVFTKCINCGSYNVS